jgi:hypothetical protein|tara:strand:+ start:574 stop:834 length:261 start_codon:yes stop_codon:yes gene_type:complete
MGKKASGKKYTSKGERKSSISTKNTDPGQRMLNKINALRKGKDVVWVLPNIDKDGKPLAPTVVKTSGKDYLAKMKQNAYQHKAVGE